MELFIVSKPNQLLTLEEAKLHAKVDFTADDSLIQDCAQMAQDFVEAETGKRLGEQTIELYFDGFRESWTCEQVNRSTRADYERYRQLVLAVSPIISVESVKYLDKDGAEQTLSPSAYTFLRGARNRIFLKPGQTWPETYNQPQSVTVTVKAGYKRNADTSAGETELPRDLLKAMHLLVNHYYNHRELVYTGLQLHEYPENLSVKAICAHHGRPNA